MIVIVVDQMRADYLSRFGHLFQDKDGFARLTGEGAWFQKAEIAHGVTMTSPGHATIATGSDPSSHGIIQNNWIDRASGEPAYAVADPLGTIIGPPGVDTTGIRGRSSAASRRPTMGNWLKVASPTSKVLSIAYKDRASILMAGSDADGAYWYEPEVGAYVTSSAFCHGQVLPPWVVDFDRSAALGEARSPTMTWERSLPAAAYEFVGADDV
ncbi:MAG TPA: alkaline phosphatase family protein, partial [Nannocystis exedens]|nr:alkaline phosphatase family protein [Nannocystis exedens]